MSTLHHVPGPAADEAFRLGLAVTTVATVAVLAALVWIDSMTLLGAALSMVLGLPIVLFATACLLSVWLGYDKRAVDVALS
jgi:hypothetical protein